MAPFSALFSPAEIGGLPLKNRLVALPIFTGYAHPNGWVSTLMIEHYSRLAGSGVAMVVVANAAVAEDGILSGHNLRVDRDDCVPGLSRLAAAIRSNGALACLQLNHGGRYAKTVRPLLPQAMEPSHLAFNMAALRDFMNVFPFGQRFGLTQRVLKMAGGWNRAMSLEDRQRTIEAFGLAAMRAQAAGFDLIELHGAGGYLLCQFLSSFTHRTSAGAVLDFNERAAFPLAVIREIERRLPQGYPIGYRLITREWVPEGVDLEEALRLARLLERERIAYLSVSAATYHSMLTGEVRKSMARPAYLEAEVGELTRQTQIPTIVAGRIDSPELADRLIREGTARLIGLGRGLQVDPDWVNRAAGRVVRKIRTCNNCLSCIKSVVLEEGFICRRWIGHIQEKTALQVKLLSRNHRGLTVIANQADMKTVLEVLPLSLPERKNIKSVLSPTFLILKEANRDPDFESRLENFHLATQSVLTRCGFPDAMLCWIVKEVTETNDREVLKQGEKGNHGLIIIPRNTQEPWRNQIVYQARRKIVVSLGRKSAWKKILVPVDMSMSTLLSLDFVRTNFLEKKGIELHFVHVLMGPAQPMQHRWEKVKRLVDIDPDLPLRWIATEGDVAEDLLQLIAAEEFDAIIMGRRGISRIKRWLLGSVSARMLTALNDETLFLID